MKKLLFFAVLGLMLLSGVVSSFAQDDSARIAEEPKDTISIDNMDPKFYEEEAPEESSSTMTYVIIGGVLVVAAAGYTFMKKKKK